MEKGRLFEQQIGVERDHLAKIREAAARRGGGGNSGGEGSNENEGVSDDDENPFVSGGFENVDSSNIAASLDADDYLQRDVDSLSEATLLSIRSDAVRLELCFE